MADTEVRVVPDGDRVSEVERLARVLDPRAWVRPVTTEEEIQFAARRRVALGQADRALTAGWVHAPAGVDVVERVAQGIWQQAADRFPTVSVSWSSASVDARDGIRWVARAALTALRDRP